MIFCLNSADRLGALQSDRSDAKALTIIVQKCLPKAAYLARLVGEKKAREIWFLCRRYKAQEALDMGLINKVVPHDELDAEAEAWAAEINQMSPTAIAIAKRSFNADTENIRGISFMGVAAVKGYYQSEESKEGVRAFNEKRKPDFKKFA